MPAPKTSKSRFGGEEDLFNKDLSSSLFNLLEADPADFLEAHNRWNVIVFALTIFTVIVWASPLGTLFNKVLKINTTAIEKITETKEYVLPDFTKPPKIGEKIGSYKVTDLPGSPRQGGARKHQGTDIAMPAGTQLYVPDLAGKKVQVKCINYKYDPATQTPGTGKTEIGANLTTSYGVQLKFRHLTKCQDGLVGGGQIFALSGYPEAPHLHVEGWRNGAVINLPKEILWWIITGANPAAKSEKSVSTKDSSASNAVD